jgi:hypothetical protein
VRYRLLFSQGITGQEAVCRRQEGRSLEETRQANRPSSREMGADGDLSGGYRSTYTEKIQRCDLNHISSTLSQLSGNDRSTIHEKNLA